MHRPSSHPSSRRVAATTTRSTALSIVALVLVASSTHLPRADAALGMALGFAVPGLGNLADIDGDGTNLFGLRGLGGQITSLLFNTAASHGYQRATGWVQAQRPGARRPIGYYNHPRSFTNSIRGRLEQQKAQERAVEKVTGILQVLQKRQEECEADFLATCPRATFPLIDAGVLTPENIETYDYSDLVCECRPAIDLDLVFDQPPLEWTPEAEAEVVQTLAAALQGGSAGRIKIVAKRQDGVDLRILPDLSSYNKEVDQHKERVSAFSTPPQLFPADFLSSLETFLSAQDLEGFGRFTFSVESPEEACTLSQDFPILCPPRLPMDKSIDGSIDP